MKCARLSIAVLPLLCASLSDLIPYPSLDLRSLLILANVHFNHSNVYT